MACKRLSFEERKSIFKFISLGLLQKEIARQLGRSKSSSRFLLIHVSMPFFQHFLVATKNLAF